MELSIQNINIQNPMIGLMEYGFMCQNVMVSFSHIVVFLMVEH